MTSLLTIATLYAHLKKRVFDEFGIQVTITREKEVMRLAESGQRVNVPLPKE